MEFKSIQFLRAVAVTLVVYMHSIALQMEHAISWQQNLFFLKYFGGIGVDMFFVISGFIISHVAMNYLGFRQGIYFLKKRFTRINPIYYMASLLFLCSAIIRWYTTNTISHVNTSRILSSFIDTIAILPISGGRSQFSPLLIVGWTLSFEWLFYSLFFLLIIFRTKQKLLVLCCSIALISIIGYFTQPIDQRIAFVSNPLMLEFVLGVVIYRVYNINNKIPFLLSLTLAILGITCYILLIIYGFGHVWISKVFYMTDIGWQRFLLWGIPSSCIVAGLVFLEKSNRLISLWNIRWIQITGDASYSIYLIHMSVFVLIGLIYKKTGFFIDPDLSVFLQLTIAILTGIGFYYIVERPLLYAIHQKNHRSESLSSKKHLAEPVLNPDLNSR